MSEENTTGGENTTPNQETSGNSISPEYGLNFNNLSFSQGPQEKTVGFEPVKEFVDDTGQWARPDAFEAAALNQSSFEALGRGAMNAVGEIIGGGVEGIGALFNWNTLSDPKNTERNFLEMLGQEMRSSIEEGNEIYDTRDETMDVLNVKWWAKNLPSLASTASMFIPGLGAGFVAGKVLSKAGRTLNRLNKAGKILDKAEDLASVQKAGQMGQAIGKQFGGAVAMRHAENMRSAHDVYQQAYEDIANYAGDLEDFKGTTAWRAAVEELGHQPTREELAAYVAGQASLQSYKVNSLNIGFDLLQMSALSKALKGTRGVRRGLRGAQQRAAAAGQELTRKQRYLARGKGIGAGLFEAGTEGIEEAVNFIGESEGRYLGKNITGRDQSTFGERWKDYVADDHMWESAFLGALGGGVMTAGGSVIGRGKATRNHEAIMEQIENRKKALGQIADKVNKAYASGTTREAQAAVKEIITAEAFGMGASAAYNGTADLLEIQLAQFEEALREEGHSENVIAQQLEAIEQQFTAAEKSVQQSKLVVAELGLDEETGMELTNELLEHDFIKNRIANKREHNKFKLQGYPVEQRKKEVLWHYLNEYINKEDAKDEVIEQLENALGGQEAVQAMTEEIVGKVEQKTTVDEATVQSAQAAADAATAKVKDLESKIPNADNDSVKSQLAEELTQAYVAEKEAQAALEEAKAGTTEDIVTEGKPIKDLGENKYDDVISSEIELDVQERELAERRAEFLSDENLEKLVAKSEERAAAKKEDRKKNRKKAKEEAKTKEELQALKKTAETSEEEQAIDDALDKMRKDAENNQRQGDQERSKDIVVPPSVQKDVDTLLENSKHIQLTEDGSAYVDSRTGQRYVRTTTWMNQDSTEAPFDPNSPYAAPSSNIGNSVDEFTRDFFDGNLRGPEAYPHITEAQMESLAAELSALEAEFLANGEKVIAKDVVLFNDMDVSELDASASGVAGTVDLLTVDKDGNFRIYDMKTIRKAREKRKTRVTGGRLIYGPNGQTLKAKHQKQLSTYRMMLMNQIGRPVPEIAIIPIDVDYANPENMTEEERDVLMANKVKYLGQTLEHTPLTSLHNMSEPDVVGHEPDPDPDPDVDPDDIQDADLSDTLLSMEQQLENEYEKVRSYERTLSTFDTMGYKKDNPKRLTVENNLAESKSKIEELKAKIEKLKNPPAPDPDGILEAGTVAIEATALLGFFARQLSVGYDQHRGAPYLVHQHEGPILMDNSIAKDNYKLLQSVLNGTNTEPVTMRVLSDTETVKGTKIRTDLKDNPAGELLTDTKTKGVKEYRPTGKGDSLQIGLYVGDQLIGMVPSTHSLMEAAEKRGRAERTTIVRSGPAKGMMWRHHRDNYGVESRVGAVRQDENRFMTEARQEDHLNNALAMHALREQLYQLHKQRKESGAAGVTAVNMELSFGQTGFGQRAQGSLIVDSSKSVRAEVIGDNIRKEGIALVLPNTDKKTMGMRRSGGRAIPIKPYQHLENREGSDQFALDRWESGSVFVPIQQNGENLWVKLPGQTISELNNGEKLASGLVGELTKATPESIAKAQNILGSNAVRMMEDGVVALFPTNINGEAYQLENAIAILRDGEWNVDNIDAVVGDMNFNIAVKVAQGESAFNSEESFAIGGINYQGISDFVAQEAKLGYSPVVDNDAKQIMGWTHPLAPAYPYNEGDQDKSFSNENTRMTRLTITASVVEGGAMKKPIVLSGKKLVDGLMENDPEVQDGDGGFGGDGSLNFRFMETATAESSNNADRATEVDMKEAEEWWAANMSSVPFKRVKGIISRHGKLGYGIFEKGAVEVSDQAVVGTEYHEAFHAVFHMFLSDDRQAKVLADAKRMYGEKSDEALEEDLAEDFREYMLTSGKSMKDKSVVRRFFSELLELINGLMKEGFAGYRKMRLFQQMNSGKFNSADPKVREYATRNMLIAENLPEYDENVQKELVQNVQSAAFVAIRAAQRGEAPAKIKAIYDDIVTINGMSRKEYNAFASEQALDGITQEDIIAKKVVSLGMEAMKYQADQVLATAPNRAVLRERYKKLFNRDAQQIGKFLSENRDVRKFVNGILDTEFTAGTNQHQQNGDSFEKMNPKDSLSANVRNLINTTPLLSLSTSEANTDIQMHMLSARMAAQEGDFAKAQQHISEVQAIVGKDATDTYFGLPQMMKVDEVFPYMSERLASKATPQAMFDELFAMGEVYPQFKLLALRLMKETPDVQAQFFAGFRRGDTTELVLGNNGYMQIKGVFGGTLANNNRTQVALRMEEIASLQSSTPAKIAKDVADYVKRNLLTTAETMSPEDFVKQATRILDGIGFQTMDVQARGRVLAMMSNNPEARAKLFADIFNVLQSYGTMANQQGQKSEDANKTYNKMLQNLAENFVAYDMGAVNTTFQNVQGSRIFSKQVPSFITEWFDQFKNLPAKGKEDALRKTLFRDPRMFDTTYGRLLFPNGPEGNLSMAGLEAMRTFRAGGIESSQAKYTEMTAEDWMATLISAHISPVRVSGNARFNFLPVTTPSDATNTMMVPAIIYQMSTKAGKQAARQALRGTIKSEFYELQRRPGRFSIPEVDDYMRRELSIREEGDMFQIEMATLPEEVLDRATDEAVRNLAQEAKELTMSEDFQRAHAKSKASKQDANVLALTMVTSTYLSNWSTGVALAGTPNEFNSRLAKNTVDMQKRHKHILSPGVANAGVTGRTDFRSVTMPESKANLKKRYEELADQGFELSDEYNSVDIADAQSYVSLEFYEDILKEHGDWTPEIGEAIAKAKRGEKLDKAQVKLLRPYKPFYYSRRFNEETGMFESQQIKNSIIPVLGKGAISEDFDKMADWMDKHRIDQVQMESAHKVGNVKGMVPMRNKDTGAFEAENYVATKEDEAKFDEEFVHSLPMTGYRKQVNVTDHWHSDSTNKLASQLEKIVTGAAVRNMGEEGAKLSNEFIQTMDEIYGEQTEKFFGQFNQEDGAWDHKKFQDWLLSEMNEDELTDSARALIKGGMYTAPSVVGAVRGRIFSAIQKEVNTIRVNGGTQVQVASQFMGTTLRPMRKGEDGKVLPAEIMVSKDSLPKKYQDMSIEEIEATAPEVLESITLRIPSEAINSGAVVKIVGFLPEGMDGVVVPDEFVTQMGSDFDVDKLFFQFRENSRDAKEQTKKDKLFDIQREIFMDPRNLEYIMAPQGFETLKAMAKRKPLRQNQESVNRNPLSLTTHASMRGDNMAGVALKGKAANRNIILEDLVRHGFVYDSPVQINGKHASFDYRKVSDRNKNIHSEAVAAAMDGAKDPVYGKLGITDNNFGLFMEVVLLADGDIESGVELVQSDAMQMEERGHIRIMNAGNDTVTIKALTEKGEEFLKQAARDSKNPTVNYKEQDFEMTVRSVYDLKTNNSAENQADLMSAIGTWRTNVSKPMSHINKSMRLDKKNVKNDIEQVMLMSPDLNLSHGKFHTPGNHEGPAVEGQYVADSLPIKRRMKTMFDQTVLLLDRAGDAYLGFLKAHSEDKLVKGLSMAQWDSHRRSRAAEVHTLKIKYTAMGERVDVSPGLVPAEKEDWSLENWIRNFRSDNETKNNPALVKVLQHLLVQPNPYNVRGTFFDNITLVGVADEVDMRLLSEAVQELYDSDNDDFVSFIEAIDAYEAQRSGYGMSQSRMTAILPMQIQTSIARAAGSHGETDAIKNTSPGAVIQEDIFNPNIQRLNLPREAAVARAMELRIPQVYRSNDGHVISPMSEDVEGNIEWMSVKSPNEGQKFKGKRKLEDVKVHLTGDNSESKSAFSKLSYSPGSTKDEKIQHLKARFRAVGMPVTVEFDNSLPENGRVVIDGKSAKITLHPDTLQGDTVAHEFGHILVEGLGYNHPLVQQGIEELRDSELWAQVEEAYPELNDRDLGMEVLVTAIGRKGTELFAERKAQTKFQTLYNRIMRAIGKLFGITPKATEQLAEKLMFGDISDMNTSDVFTRQYQKRADTVQEAIEESRREMREYLRNLRRRKGTSEEAKDALNRAYQLEKRLKSKATVGVKMAAVKNAAVDATRLARATSEELTQYINGQSNIANPGIKPEEQILLDKAYTTREELNRLDAAIKSFEGTEAIGPAQAKILEEMKQARADMREAFEELNEKAREAISKKLLAQSTDNTLTEADLAGINVFDLFDYARTKHLAKDASGVGIATLGGAELKNAVMQLAHKLASGIMDSANFEAKQDGAKLQQLLDSSNVPFESLLSADGKYLITEFNREYFEEREKARRQGLRALAEFDADNTNMAETAEYQKQFVLEHKIDIDSAAFEILDRMRNPQLNNAIIRKESRKLAENLEHMGHDFAKFHDISVAEGFDVAYEEAKRTQEEEIARIDAAREAGEDYEKDYTAVNALNRFVAENQVAMINGKAVPMAGKYAQHTVKEQYKNAEFKGKPRPMAKHANAEWAAAGTEVQGVLTGMRDIFERATGSHGTEMIERGYLPTYESHKGESTTDMLKKKREKLKATIEAAKDKATRDAKIKELENIEHMIGNEQGVDSQGNPVYTTNSGRWKFAHRNKEFNGFTDKKNFTDNMKQFVVDSHKHTARKSLESVAYLTRGFLADSKVVDSNHTFGKKQEAWKNGGQSNIIKVFDAFFEGTISENWRDKSSLDSFADGVQTYTSLMGVGLNPSAWVNNYGYGAVQNRLVNLGEGVYSKESLKRANKVLRENGTKLMSDLWTGKRSLDNKALAIIHTFDIAEDQRELPFNMRETNVDKAFSKAFIGQTYGELMLQNSVMFAMMMDTEVELANGEKTNLFDALEHDPTTGAISFPEGATMKSGARMVPLNSDSMGAFTNKVRHQNQYVHGAYNKQDSGLLQRKWYGRLAMQFRRWLPMGMKSRFSARHYNEAREREEIGTYRALRHVFAAILQDVSEAKKLIQKLDTMSAEDQFMHRHARRAIIEVLGGTALLAATTMLVALVGGGDDEMNWLTAFAASRTERLGMELITYTPIGLIDLTNQIGKDPMAGGARLENLVMIGGYAVADMLRLATGNDVARYEGGMNRGKSKLGVKAVKAMPLFDHANRIIDIPSNFMAYSNIKTIIG